MKIIVESVDAFTKNSAGGNPAGVVLNSDSLSEDQMLKISAGVGFSETAFVQSSKKSDFRLRFFTPKAEVDICGHATVAAFTLLNKRKLIKVGNYSAETKAGVIDVEVCSDGVVMMEQKKPIFSETLDAKEIADSLNISTDKIYSKLPVQIVSTGLRDILIPIERLDDLQAIRPNFNKVKKISKNNNTIGYHLFTLETLNSSTAHCRNLAPLYGIPEEAATGTSNAALACYLHKYKIVNEKEANRLSFEQGYFMNRASEIIVKLKIKNKAIEKVFVGGKATGSMNTRGRFSI